MMKTKLKTAKNQIGKKEVLTQISIWRLV